MKGDFSRSTFDPGKHYRGVRMQQGRVQVDADWNEQADILLYLIATQLKDLLGPGATAATDPPGFAISLVEPAEEPVDQDEAGQPEEPTALVRTLPDFQIGAGRYYVDGVLCENDAPVLFSRQPDYPAGSAELQKGADADYVLVYLDVWQRHLTAWEDPTIREIALGGPDTTTRVKTVWQVKLLPLSGDPADDQGWRDHGALRSLADWEAFVEQATGKGRRLQAKWEKEKGVILENHLYRVEIHTVADDQVTFKWSRENGSVVFPIREEYLFTWEDVPGKDRDRLLSYLREGLALDWAEGANISKPDDGPTIRIEKDGDWAQIVLDEGEKTATLTTSDGKRRVLKVRPKNEKLNVYTYIRRIEEEYLFAWEDVPGEDRDRLLSYLREGLALDWAEGNQISISKDGPTIRIEKDGDWAQIVLDEGEKTATLTTSDGKRRVLKVRQEKDKRSIYSEMIELNLEGLDRDPFQLSPNDWVEIVDDVTVLNGRPLPLCQVAELDRPNASVTLHADQDRIDQILAEIGARELHHPLLRRWESAQDSEEGVTIVEAEKWLPLENGIQVRFSGGSGYHVGDYWLIPARTHLDQGIEWPQKDGQPLAQAPHGIAHHYAPLALLQFQEGGWSVIPGAGTGFHSLPQMTAQLSTTDEQLQSMASHLKKIQETLDTLVEQCSRIQAHIFQDFSALDALEVGHVVAFDPSREDHVTLASKENERLVVGVVTEPIDKDNQRCRVALYGRVRCKVVGRVEPGDLLVPSHVSGHAQKAGLYLQPGTILGKALGDKDEETDTVDTLVTLG